MKNSAAFRVRNKYQHTTWVYYRIFNVTYIWKFYLQLALTTACWYLVWHLYVEAISLSGQKFLLPVFKPKMQRIIAKSHCFNRISIKIVLELLIKFFLSYLLLYYIQERICQCSMIPFFTFIFLHFFNQAFDKFLSLASKISLGFFLTWCKIFVDWLSNPATQVTLAGLG